MISNYNDGSSAASSGAAQLPTLLAGYATRPSWEVAGVDYAVGAPAGATLADPAGISMAGVSVNAGQHAVYVTGNDVTLNGYDFGLAGGWQVYINPGATGTVIENSAFQVGANQKVPIQAAVGSGSLTVQHCSLDGGGVPSDAVWALISYDGSGTFVAKYNSFTNAPADAIDFSSGNLTYDVSNNLFDNLGISPGAHPDSIQEYGGDSTNSVFDFNTVYQPNPSGMQGIQLGAQGGSTISNTQIENNVVLAKGPSLKMSYSIAVSQGAGSPIIGATVSDNYIDSSGAYGPFYPPSGTGLTFEGNVDLTTGATLASPSGTSSTDVKGVSGSPSSGTQTTGAVISIALAMDQAFFVTGAPSLTLNDGGTATYVSGSGTTGLVFQTVVTTADHSVGTLAVTGMSLAGAAIADADGNAANLAGADASLPGLGVSVTGAAPPTPPTLAWSPGSAAGTEGAPIRLAALSEGLNGEVAQTLVISNIPVGATLTDGANRFTATSGATSASVAGWNLAALSITPVADGTFTLAAAATTVTATGAPAGSANATESVSVAPLAPVEAWAPAAPGVAGASMSLGLLTAAPSGLAADHNTLRSIVVSGAPSGVVLSDGVHSFTATASASSVDVTGWNLADLQATAPMAASFTLVATATEQDALGATSVATASEAVVAVAPPPPSPPPGSDPYADGSAGASGGAAELPKLLTSYAARPAWQVAGVDYAVGAPAGAALRDPTVAANLPAGVYIDAANHLIHVDGANVTLNGYDFGLHGGWGVQIDAGTTGTTTISNSSFSMGAGEPIAINASSTNVGNLVVIHDTFNGNQADIPSVLPPPAGTGLGSAVNYNGNGSFTGEYNYLYGLPADGFDFSDGTVAPTVKYNLFAGIGYTPGAHSDAVQFYADTVNNAVVAFNTIYTPQGSNLAGNEGLQIEAQGGSTITNTTLENNTIIATGPRMTQSLNIATWQDPGNTLAGAIVANNYFDPTASYGAFGFGNSAPEGSNLSFVGNTSLLDGTQFATPSNVRTTDVTGVTDMPSSGVQSAGAVVLLTLAMDQAETVVGTPTLSLNDGGTASYVSGSGTNALTFQYVVGATDSKVSALTVTAANLPGGAAIRDASGSMQNLSGADVALPNVSTAGPAANSIVLNLSEDAYLGDAQFLVSIDGVQQGPARSVTALHKAGQSEAFTYATGAGSHAVRVSFINDAYGGTASTDRNLYVDSVSYDGTPAPGSSATLLSNGSVGFEVGTAPPPPTDDTLVLNLSEDAYLGNAQFIAYVDGKALGPAQSVSVLHASGASEAFTFLGAFGAGAHTVEVDFINDAYGGSPSTDRNLYVSSIGFDGQAYAADKATLLSTGGFQFTVGIANTAINTALAVPLHR